MKNSKSVPYFRALLLGAAVAAVLLAGQPANAEIKSYVDKPIGRLSFKNSNELKSTSSTVPSRVGPDTRVGVTPTQRSIIQVDFCAELSSAAGAGVIAVAIIDPGQGQTIISPGTIVLDAALDAGIETRCFQWIHYFVEAGSHFVEIHWASTVDGTAVESRRRTTSITAR